MDPSSSLSLVPCSSSYYKSKMDDDKPFNWCKRPKHDVFLSYSNEDVGKSFVSHLKGALLRNCFHISDHTMLPIGQDESSQLLKAIEESWICVVVLSTNYPFSVNCLDELLLIMESSKKRRVFPIFFKVDPSHVRSQQHASFLEAFQAHRQNHHVDVEKWRHALKDVGGRAGDHFKTGENEEEFVRKIVKILGKSKLPLEVFDADHPVGIEPRAQDLISKLRLADPDPSITAVLGMSGSGKTTLVKAVYDTIVPYFDANCFIESISYYKHNGPNWKVVLQHDVISRFTGEDYRIHNVVAAANIRNFVSSRKVLLVLDDVDKYEQLQALGIQHHASFGWGSRILVTTTNKQSLSGLQKYTSYDVSLLDEWESSELFTGLAYENGQSADEKFVDEIAYRARGVPLVLEVWGRYFKSHERKQWPKLLEKLRRIPHEDVQKKLQVSYDSLSPRAKNLFLDIACFFDGMKKDLVIKVLEDDDNAFFPDIEIQDLIDKSLVKEEEKYHDDLDGGLDDDDDDGGLVLRMHEVIREMGREVVRQENEDDPGQRSRLVNEKDVVRVFRDCSGSDSIRSIYLDLDRDDLDEEAITAVQVEATLRKMSNLRFIKIQNDQPRWSYSYGGSNDDEIIIRRMYAAPLCFKHLKYLEWEYFPFKCLDNFHMGRNVVVIKLRNSDLETLWEGALKSLKKLRILNVSCSSYLIRTGSFIGLENLEELSFTGCENLEELDTSIGCLQKLVKLYLSECKQLKRVPWEMIGKLTSLVELDLEQCPNIFNSFPSLPDSLCQLHQLNTLILSHCANLKSIPNLPPNIQHLYASGCRSLVSLPDDSLFCQLHQLRYLYLYNCANLKSIPNLPPNIQRLDARGCRSLASLPDDSLFCQLHQLSEIDLSNCANLKSIPNLPPNIQRLDARGCRSLVSLPDDSLFCQLHQLRYLYLSNCDNLKSIPNLPPNIQHLDASGCSSLVSLPDDSLFCQLHQLSEIYLSNCDNLKSIPNLPPNIQRLDARGCRSLVSLPDDSLFCQLHQLSEIYLSNCDNLKSIPNLPPNIQRLDARGCRSLVSLPDDSLFCQLHQLSEIYLSNCDNLKSIPNLPPNIQRLDARGCRSLVSLPDDSLFCQLHQPSEIYLSNCDNLKSIPNLPPNIQRLDARGCRSLVSLPDDSLFCQLHQLSEIYLSNCDNLKSIPNLPPNIQRLDARGCRSLVSLPDDSLFCQLHQLSEIYLSNCDNLKSIPNLPPNIQRLDARGCRSLVSLPDDSLFCQLHQPSEIYLSNCDNLKSIPNLPPNIQRLDARGCRSLVSLPDDSLFCQLHQLSEIYLSNCDNLKSIPNLPPNIQRLDARGCRSLVSLPDDSLFCQLHQLSEIYLSNCDNLKSIPNLPPNIQELDVSGCRSLVSLPSNMYGLQFLKKLWLDNCVLLGSEGFVKVTGLRNLEILLMRNCNVSQVSSVIGNLVSLEYLYLSGNTFWSLPDSVSNLSRLRRLEINDCRQLKRLPLLPSNLREIKARGCWSLDVMPFDSGQLGHVYRSKWCSRQLLVNSQLERDCGSLVSLPSNMFELQFLTELGLESCNLSQVSSEIGNLVSLEYLYLSGNTFWSLPDSVSNLSRLRHLDINDCRQLKRLPLLPSKLRVIEARGCGSLDVMPFDSRQMGYVFRSQWCKQLLVDSSLTRGLDIDLSRKEEEEEFVIPEWCSSYTISIVSGNEFSFVAPVTTQLDMKICGVIVYAYRCGSEITILNKTKGTSHRFCEQSWNYSGYSAGYVPVMMGLYPLNDKTLVVEAGDTVLIPYGAENFKEFSYSCGVRWIYEDDLVGDAYLSKLDLNGIHVLLEEK